MIHHYTTIENLALILESQRIRFTRMDLVDDVKEVDGLVEGLSKITFISCWTKDEEENIALWKMYTDNMRGVKISFQDIPFKMHIIRPGKYANGAFTNDSDCESYLPKEELFSDTHFVIPLFDTLATEKTMQRFFKDVEYVEDYKHIYSGLIRHETKNDRYDLNRFFEIGKYKSSKWAFQKESRFTLYCYPLLPLKHPSINGSPYRQFGLAKDYPYHPEYPEYRDLKFREYFDVPLDSKSINNIQITLGPNTTKADSIIVESLLQHFTSNGKVTSSNLQGEIRFKR